MLNLKNTDLWDYLQKKWPVCIEGRSLDYDGLIKHGEDFFAERSVNVISFSHFGFVVDSIDKILTRIKTDIYSSVQLSVKDYVNAYKVKVGRITVDQKELEFIEPVGQSFFMDSLINQGPCLQHISFVIKDIENILQKLKNTGVTLIDEKPNSGSHGKVAFIKSRDFKPLYLELCQLHD